MLFPLKPPRVSALLLLSSYFLGPVSSDAFLSVQHSNLCDVKKKKNQQKKKKKKKDKKLRGEPVL